MPRRSRPGTADCHSFVVFPPKVSRLTLAYSLTTKMKRKQQHRNAPSKTLKVPSQPVANDVTPKRPRRSAARIAFGLAMSAALVLFNSKSAEQYVVCSSSQKIYTVDPTNPRVECMSVKGSRIGRVGSYREFKHWPALFKRSLTHVFFKVDVMSSYNYLSPFSAVLPAWVNQNVRIGPSVKTVHLDADSAVVPGLAGPLCPSYLHLNQG